MVTFADKVVPMSPSDPFDSSCLIGCAVLTGAGAVLHTAGVEPGQSVAVLGAGALACRRLEPRPLPVLIPSSRST
jgi:Zn-dependent alcohol dehydrogenase